MAHGYAKYGCAAGLSAGDASEMAEQSERGEVGRALEEVERAVQNLDMFAGILVKGVQRALREEEPGGCVAGEPTPYTAPLAVALAERAGHIRRISERIRNASSRLEL